MSGSVKVVTRDIPIGDVGSGVFYYRAGDKIDAETVKANGWDDYVTGPSTKAAEQVTSDLTKGGK